MIKVEGGLQPQVIKLEGIENGKHSQVLDDMCDVIPDYQRDIALLKSQLAHKAALCDTFEGKLTHKTRMTNQQSDYISKLEEQIKKHLLEQLAWSRRGTELENRIKELQEQLDTCSNLKQMLEQTRFTAEILASTLADGRAAKRQRV